MMASPLSPHLFHLGKDSVERRRGRMDAYCLALVSAFASLASGFASFEGSSLAEGFGSAFGGGFASAFFWGGGAAGLASSGFFCFETLSAFGKFRFLM